MSFHFSVTSPSKFLIFIIYHLELTPEVDKVITKWFYSEQNCNVLFKYNKVMYFEKKNKMIERGSLGYVPQNLKKIKLNTNSLYFGMLFHSSKIILYDCI